MKEFRDRIAVVTGGASGVGYALAKAFVGEGSGTQVGVGDGGRQPRGTTPPPIGAPAATLGRG